MTSMLYGCSSLSSLNLSNFNFSSLTEAKNFLKNCFNLEYINLANFDDSYITTISKNYDGFFENIPDNLVICVEDENKIQNTINSQLEKLICHVINCSNDWKSKQKKIQ